MSDVAKQTDNMSALIRNQMRTIAGEYFDEVWTELRAEQVDIDLIGQVFAEKAVSKIASECGEEQARLMIARLQEIDKLGFPPENYVLQ